MNRGPLRVGMTTLAEGALAVGLAREAVTLGLARSEPPKDPAAPFRGRPLPPVFEERRGLFATFTHYPEDRLRGCVGFPFPIYPLRAAVPRAAWAAATEDPRFRAIRASELASLRLELSILTVPESLPDPASRIQDVVVGRDGLIVESEGASGLLLPQVAVDEGWGSERFLAETCRKAGVGTDRWNRPETTVQRFRAEIFREISPGGAVEVHSLG